jgi:septin family protein
MSDFNPRLKGQKLSVDLEEFKLDVPSKTLVFGPSGVGKTAFLLQLLKNEFFKKPFKEIYVCVPEQASHLLHNSINDFKDATNNSIIIYEGVLVPDFTDFSEDFQRLIIYDDLFDQIAEDSRMARFMTFSSRKSYVSCIITCQNPFVRSRYSITVRRQMNYLVSI